MNGNIDNWSSGGHVGNDGAGLGGTGDSGGESRVIQL